MQAQFVSDFGGVHGFMQVLLVGKYKKSCITQFLLPKKMMYCDMQLILM